MGWLGTIIEKVNRKVNGAKYANMLSGSTPIFSQFGTDIYASDVVQQAINCITQEIKKLRPTHIRTVENDVIPINGAIQSVLNNPNPFMTASEFLEKITWLLFLNCNVFILPTYTRWKDEKGEHKRLDGLYPLMPNQVDFLEDEKNNMYIKFRFQNGYESTIKYSEVIHIKHRYSINALMGGNENGQPDNQALLKTLEINNDMMQGISAAMKSSFAINGVVKFKTMMDDGKTEKALKDLEEKLKKSESGFLPLDIQADYMQMKRDIKMVDAETLKFIDEKILRQYGVPLPILSGDYTKAQYEAFYQKTLEPIIINYHQAFTKVLFSPTERNGYGNSIQFYPKDLIFMSTEQTLEMIRLLGDSGALFENEKRTALGLRPLEELSGLRMQSLNYVNVNIAEEYQTRSTQTNININNGKEKKNGEETQKGN